MTAVITETTEKFSTYSLWAKLWPLFAFLHFCLFARQNGRKRQKVTCFFLMDDNILPFLEVFLIM